MAGDIRVTNVSQGIEEQSIDKTVRITNVAEMVVFKQTTGLVRVTNAAIMIEIRQTHIYDRITNVAIMGEWLPPKLINLNTGIIAILGPSITLDVPPHPYNYYRDPMTKCIEIGAGGTNPLPPSSLD